MFNYLIFIVEKYLMLKFFKVIFVLLVFNTFFHLNAQSNSQVDVTFENGDRYVGQVSNNKKNGVGTYITINGNKYVGEWKDDIMEGQGILIDQDGKYEGKFLNGLMHGNGILTLKNGRVYKGQFKDNKMHGNGILTDADGKYEGQFFNGLMHGNGVLTLNNGQVFRGEFKNNKYVSSQTSNQVDFTNANGDRYIGEVLNNKKHGSGTYIDANGNKYAGQWKNNMMHGNGILTLSNGRVFKGDFKNNKYVNSMSSNKVDVTLDNGDRYIGEVLNNKMHGHGTYLDANGNKYVGEWKNNMMHGQGVLKSSNGEKYQGEFKNNKKHGDGNYTDEKNELVIYGQFKNDIPDGMITMISYKKNDTLEKKLQMSIEEVKIIGKFENLKFSDNARKFINGKPIKEYLQRKPLEQNTILESLFSTGFALATNQFLGNDNNINSLNIPKNTNISGGFSLGNPIIKKAILNLTTAQSFILYAFGEKEAATAAKIYAEKINAGEGLGEDGMEKLIVKSHEWQTIINKKIEDGYVLDEKSKKEFSKGVPYYTNGLILCVRGGFDVSSQVSNISNLSSVGGVLSGINLLFTAVDSFQALGLFFSSTSKIISFGKDHNIENIEEIEKARSSLGV